MKKQVFRQKSGLLRLRSQCRSGEGAARCTLYDGAFVPIYDSLQAGLSVLNSCRSQAAFYCTRQNPIHRCNLLSISHGCTRKNCEPPQDKKTSHQLIQCKLRFQTVSRGLDTILLGHLLSFRTDRMSRLQGALQCGAND